MRVLLVNPSPNVRTWGSYSVLPLGLAYLAGYMEQRGHDVRVLDMTVRPLSEEDLCRHLRDLQPDVVGVTATTPVIKSAWRVCLLAREVSSAFTVIGGPHVSALPEESAAHEFVDAVVVHEGEATLAELCEKLSSGGNLGEVNGIVFRANGRVARTNPRELIANLDDLPMPARHLFPSLADYSPSQPYLSRRKPAANILTSRGCPYSCVFCYKGVFGPRFRARSPESVIAEWRVLVREYGVREIEVVDDNFALNADRALEICERIVAEKLVVPWATYSGIRVDHRDYHRLLEAMKRSGCYRILFGLESGSDEVLRGLGKKITTTQAKEAVKVAQSLGFQTVGSFMIGNPGENLATIEKTIAFARELNTDYAQFLIATPFPGSPLSEVVKKEGKFLVHDWDEYDNMGARAFFEMGEVRQELVVRMRQRAYRSFYLRPVFVWSLARRLARNPGDILRLAGGFSKWLRL